VIIRQHVLDHPADHAVLILVPSHLLRQWQEELTQRFRLGSLLGGSVRLCGYEDEEALTRHTPAASLLVIDEAHQLAAWVSAPPGTPERRRFDLVRAAACRLGTRLLLLSATPALHTDETGFQALLHLLDPVLYPLGAMDAFGERLKRHEHVAHLYHQFRPDEEGHYLEGSLDRLAEFFPSDRRLRVLADELRPLLAYGADPDDPRREELVRAVRSHVSETYCLHRRLLRNRRTHERVDGLLPGRSGAWYWTYADPAQEAFVGLLDEWRVLASLDDGEGSCERAECFRLLAEAAACDATALAAVVAARLAPGEDPDDLALSARERQALRGAPRFAGEEVVLHRLADAARAGESLARVDCLAERLRQRFAEQADSRAVVFVSYPSVADEVFHALKVVWPGAVVRHGQAGWQHFRTDRTFRVLVCDRTAEEGLNLQGRRTFLVHHDLPWSPNRVEQRLGRLDRYGVASAVRSAVLLAEGDPLARAWADCLAQTYRVFERSVAALQYLIDTEMAALLPAVLRGGVEALTESARRLAGPGGEIERVLHEIQILDELDAVEVPPGQEHFADRLAEADQLRRADWEAAADGWVVEALKFARVPDQGRDFEVRRYQFGRPKLQGPSTLMPVGRLVRDFAHVLDREDQRSTPRCPLTYALAFDRQRAQNRRVALARIGDPFLNAVADYVRWDDRGMCFAMWRYRPGLAASRPADVYLRFDFVAECSTAAALAALRSRGDWSEEAVRRQADWLFPPLPVTVWVDGDLDPVTDPARLALLTAPYAKGSRSDGGRDHNLSRNWPIIAPHFPRGEWVALVGDARRRAEQIVRAAPAFTEAVRERLADARQAEADRAAQFASRLAFLAEAQRGEEESRAETDRAVLAALAAGIEAPEVRLDSLGAVFLADWDPLEEAEA
jgi:ATP-dependent helicase HepA